LGDGKRVRSFQVIGIFACFETRYIVRAGDIQKSSRLRAKTADALCWIKKEENNNRFDLAPVRQKASISNITKSDWN